MNLIESMATDCTMMDKVSKSDGYGGFTTAWTDGASFKAAIVKDNSLDARVAEKEGVTETYTVTVPKGTPMDFHDVFRRNSDGTIFRATSNIIDSQSPEVATFSIAQFTAERWNPTT